MIARHLGYDLPVKIVPLHDKAIRKIIIAVFGIIKPAVLGPVSIFTAPNLNRKSQNLWLPYLAFWCRLIALPEYQWILLSIDRRKYQNKKNQ